jgi:hypothetical protein
LQTTADPFAELRKLARRTAQRGAFTASQAR